jgi:phosphoenolpyruvate synthase/pyruvate phosphate dikinase
MKVKHLKDIRAADRQTAGGKAASLGELAAAGHPVPNGFVVLASDEPLNPEDILRAYDGLALGNVAVRSSGIGEDGQNQSWAGQFATLLHVQRDGLLGAVQACLDSAKAARVQAYGNALALAVLVQQMIHSQTAGVAFSSNPITGDRDEIMIEAVYGLGELLVQGTVTPDNYLLTHAGQLIEQDIAHKPILLTYENGATTELAVDPARQHQPALSSNQLRDIVRMVTRIEAHYDYPVDVEWAYDQTGRLHLLQARPITT